MEDWQVAIIEMRRDIRTLVEQQNRLLYVLLLTVIVLAGADKVLAVL